MTTRPKDKLATHFAAPGSLPRPALLGRAVRFALGTWLLVAFYSLVVGGVGLLETEPPAHWTFWVFTAFALWVTPAVVNIGFAKNWRRKPQLFLLAGAALAIVADLAFYGSWWGPPLGLLVWTWLLYFCAHLGVSFVLAAFIATPGCEMRALPHLWMLITGRATQEHYCPGFLDSLDRWELRWSARAPVREDDRGHYRAKPQDLSPTDDPTHRSSRGSTNYADRADDPAAGGSLPDGR